MEMTGKYRISAARQVVWDALNDPGVLKRCLRGCEHLELVSDTEFEATVAAKVGPVKMNLKGAVELSNVDPANGYAISGEGKGGAAGYACGGAQVQLAGDGDTTVLTYTVDATLGGQAGPDGLAGH